MSGVGVMVTLCSGRCYDYCDCWQMICLQLWHMLFPNLVLWCSRWWATEADVLASLLSNYSHVADGIASFRVDSFQFKFWDVKQNLFPYVRQMLFCLCSYWGMDCSPLYIASLIVLIRFWSSLLTMLKLSMVILWSMMLKWSYIGEGP